MSTSMRRWLWGGWAVLVLVGGAATLYLEGPAAAPGEPRLRRERPSAPAPDPVPCPSAGPAAPEGPHSCSSWQRG